MDTQLRVGLVGAGPWATRVHAPGIANHPRTELTAVWARRPDAATAVAEPHNAGVAPDFAALCAGVDAVAFAVPPSVQADMALRAAQAGKHLILEKPVAATVNAARKLADAVADAGVASLVMLTRRFDPAFVDWLADVQRTAGWTGGCASWLSGALLGGEFAGSAWRHSDGALADVGPHSIDLLDAALGPVAEVFAAHRSSADLWHLLLGHSGGATSTVSLSLRLPVRPTITELTVYGASGRRSLPAAAASANHCFSALLNDFVRMVDHGTATHPCDVHRGVHLQRVLDAAGRSALDGGSQRV